MVWGGGRKQPFRETGEGLEDGGKAKREELKGRGEKSGEPYQLLHSLPGGARVEGGGHEGGSKGQLRAPRWLRGERDLEPGRLEGGIR